MTNQEKHFEENKEHRKISEDHPNSIFVQNPPKAYILFFFQLPFTYPLSILYCLPFPLIFWDFSCC